MSERGRAHAHAHVWRDIAVDMLWKWLRNKPVETKVYDHTFTNTKYRNEHIKYGTVLQRQQIKTQIDDDEIKIMYDLLLLGLLSHLLLSPLFSFCNMQVHHCFCLFCLSNLFSYLDSSFGQLLLCLQIFQYCFFLYIKKQKVHTTSSVLTRSGLRIES